MPAALTITPSSTPNPNARKFTLDRPVGATMLNMSNSAEAAGQPLAAALFALPGVVNVFMTGNFITVNKRADVEWSALEADIIAMIRAYYELP